MRHACKPIRRSRQTLMTMGRSESHDPPALH